MLGTGSFHCPQALVESPFGLGDAVHCAVDCRFESGCQDFVADVKAADQPWRALQRLDRRHEIRAHVRRVDVVVAQGGVLNDRQKRKLTTEAPRHAVHGMNATYRVYGSAVVLRRNFGRPHDGQGVRRDQGLPGRAAPQFDQRVFDHSNWIGLLDEAHQPLHLGAKLNRCEHGSAQSNSPNLDGMSGESVVKAGINPTTRSVPFVIDSNVAHRRTRAA